MNGVTDSTKLLKEKLSLSRELSILKPELEHLRSQAAFQQMVLSEKLALQRQVSTLEVELETEKRALKRASEKGKNKDRELELQQQVDDLQKDLAREKRERDKARKEAEKEVEVERRALKRANEKLNNKEREVELQQELEDLRSELTLQTREGEKLRKELQKRLEAEQRGSKRAAEQNSNSKEKGLELQQQLQELEASLAQEKREREKARKEAERELRAFETENTVLESKLDQVRTKLRAAKEEVKECQTELGQARAALSKGSTSSIRGSDVQPKNPRKRTAMEFSGDVAIGTPDGVAVRGKRPAVKRGRIDHTMVGEKSMFSITPYLNRTSNLASGSPVQGELDHARANEGILGQNDLNNVLHEKACQKEVSLSEASPSVQPKLKTKKKAVEKKAIGEKKPLGESKEGVNMKKSAAKRPRAILTLERVAEEDDSENKEVRPASSIPKSSMAKPNVCESPKVPTVLVQEAEPKKKKRKLLGAGKTLFDEEDGEATKRPARVPLGPPRIVGKGGLPGPKSSMTGGIGTATGFGAFSPLKKDRRGVGASFLA